MLDEIGRMSIVVITTLALILAPALTAVWFIQRRKRAARQRRRSPLTTSLLRAPGQTLRDKIEDMRIDVGMETMLLMVVPMFPLAFFQIHAQVTGRLTSVWLLSVLAVPTLAFVALQVRKLVRASAEMDKVRLGLDAELAVGQELQQLMLEGALVFHDMPAERFNIDHVVVARQGVFAIETKGYTKPIRDRGAEDATVVYDGRSLTLPDRSGSWAIDQAQRQAKWLAAWLTGATAEPVHVVPVLAMPGWFVDRKGSGPVSVLSGKELRSHLLRIRSAKPLSAEQVQRVASQVERHCRNVEPSYRPDTQQTA